MDGEDSDTGFDLSVNWRATDKGGGEAVERRKLNTTSIPTRSLQELGLGEERKLGYAGKPEKPTGNMGTPGRSSAYIGILYHIIS